MKFFLQTRFSQKTLSHLHPRRKKPSNYVNVKAVVGMGDTDPQEVVARIAKSMIVLQYMERVMGFGIQNATVITLGM